ncbi:MAG: hypothetical protein HQL20_02865 [Candidatus Omnitrophica bacterium]|nr:hypothetical protein [Candidatus Omnitrophota bacterium]
MAKCPACSAEVSLLYQLIAPFFGTSLFWKNAFSLRHDTIVICNHCGRELRVANPFDVIANVTLLLGFVGTAFLLLYLDTHIYQYLDFYNKNNNWSILFIGLPFFLIMGIVCSLVWGFCIQLKLSDE